MITSIFVESSLATASSNYGLALEAQNSNYLSSIKELLKLFDNLNANGNTTLTQAEWVAFCEKNANAHNMLALIGLETANPGNIFKLLDVKGKGSMEIVDFVEVCMRLRGAARTIDVQEPLQNRKVASRARNIKELRQLCEGDVGSARASVEADERGIKEMTLKTSAEQGFNLIIGRRKTRLHGFIVNWTL